MNVCISIAAHELEMAHRWMDWVCELGGTDGHSLLLIPASGMDIKDIIQKAEKAFSGRVSIIVDYEGQTSDWQVTEPMRSASGPNSSFRQVAWHFYHNKLGPYFWCELDCIPLKKDWLDRLEAEYKSCGKPFLGAYVEIANVPVHLSGNAIYVNVPQEAPTLVMRTEWTPKGQDKSFELAFDIAGAKETVPKSHFTKLIQHKFRYAGFKSRKEFDAVIDPNAVVFHSDKSGTIFPYLRENLYSGCDFKHTLKDGNYQIDVTEPTPVQPIPSKVDNREVTDVTIQTRTYSYSDILERAAAEPSGLAPISEPWKNKADSETEVRLLCTALSTFCKSPVYKHRVREALREAKIIK